MSRDLFGKGRGGWGARGRGAGGGIDSDAVVFLVSEGRSQGTRPAFNMEAGWREREGESDGAAGEDDNN